MTQNPTPRCPVMTTTAGAPVVDNQNSLTAGPRGPVLMQDWHLLEKLAHQNRERIPERVVHAKGWGAFGTFTVTQDITRYTCASIFSEVGKVTPLVTRFSTVAGEMGAADAERDVRGFAVKFYTDQGNWDLVGNNTPVFFIRDPLKFPDFIHTQKRHPRTHLRSATAAWDFWSLSPESLHQVTILMSDRGIPASPRFMNGYGRQPHLQSLERPGRTLLGEIPLQGAAGPSHPYQRRGRGPHRQDPRKLPGGSLQRHRARRVPEMDAIYPGHARG